MSNSRIKRRNKFGYSGIGTPKWTKNNIHGDYRSPVDNNKHLSVNLFQQNLVNIAKKEELSHPGSKKISTLRQYLITPTKRKRQQAFINRLLHRKTIINK